MGKIRSSRRRGDVLAIVFGVLLTSLPAHAQLHTSGLALTEYDTNETVLVLGGISVSPAGLGWKPVAGVQAYYLSYPQGGSDRANIYSLRPAVGLKDSFASGDLEGLVGYAFRTRDALPISTIVPDPGDGVVVSGELDYWGTGGPLGAQALASYNFGSESLWTRGRVTTRVSQSGARQMRIGAETAYMTAPTFSAFQPGGVFEWHNGKGWIFGLGAGAKLIHDGEDAVYGRFEVVFPVL